MEDTDMVKMVAEQMEFSRARIPVMGNAEYERFEWQLNFIDELLVESGLERRAVEVGLVRWEEEVRREAVKAGREYRVPTAIVLARWQRMLRQALRCNLARYWTERPYRRFSRRLAESALWQTFCRIDRLEIVRVPSKSTLDRYAKMFPESEVRELANRLNRLAVEGKVGLKTRMDLESTLSDSTCVKAMIHFPTDWVLLRDGVRTLMKSILVIRRHGMKRRMPEPEQFLRSINRLSIAMSQSRRRENSRKSRKAVLRQMKRLSKVVMRHASRYRQELSRNWEKETDLREGHVRVILNRLDGILAQLPTAIHQAHERLIGERRVANGQKILSLYDDDLHVIVRGKADAEVEFGNTLWLTEQGQGLIIDWKLLKDMSPGDAKLMRLSQHRLRGVFGRYPGSATGDRGLWSRENADWLKKEGIFNALCPRDPAELRKRMKSLRFRTLQKRRAQTEGRIGILKNDFLGHPLNSKGFTNREGAVTWAVLCHNLWRLSSLAWAEDRQERQKKKVA
jgi:hypothetical protein